jgi:ribosomal-protein-alanine N-acetyltransferase
MARVSVASPINLRLARQQDAPAMARMSRDLIETGLGWSYRSPRIRRLIADRDTIALVAGEADEVLGFAIMSFGEERAHLVLLAVEPSMQRQGVARRMVEWLVESAEAAGIALISLELRADNAGARSFYRSLGFCSTLMLPGYYRRQHAALRMSRLLRTRFAGPTDWPLPGLGKASPK